MRIAILPRATAAAIANAAVSAVGWSAGAVTIVMAIPVVVETMLLRGRGADLPPPLALLLIMLAGIGAVVLKPRRWVAALFLGLGAALTVGYEVLLLADHTVLVEDARFIVNRPAIALVAVGPVATTAGAGIAWLAGAWAVSMAAAYAAAVITGAPFDPGYGTTIVLGIGTIAYLTLAVIQSRVRRSVPDFDVLEAENQLKSIEEDLARRTTAVVHDTVLNDLAIIMSAPGRIDDRVRERLRADLRVLRDAEWLTVPEARLPAEEAALRNELRRIANEYRWRGLSIHVTGAVDDRHRIAPAVAEAMLGALRAALENVLRHSGAATAEVEMIATDAEVTVMVTDRGRGFHPDAVAPDRLGIRTSIVERMAAVGGRAQIWSSPGEGTSVVITAPAAGVVAS